MILLDIARVISTPGEVQSIEKYFSLGEIQSQLGLVTFDSPIMLKGTMSNEAGILSLSGYLLGSANVTCGRCLEPFKLDFKAKFEEIFYSNLIDGQEPSEEWVKFEGSKLDITDEAIKSILADLPMKVLCDENCKGLCPVCGINRNQKECNCKNEDIDPRLEALKRLLD